MEVASAFPKFRAQCDATLVRVCMLESNLEAAASIIATVRKDAENDAMLQKALQDPEVVGAFNEAEFASDVEGLEYKNLEECAAAIASDPSNQKALYDQAVLHFVSGSCEDAINSACKCMMTNRSWNEGGAKKLTERMVKAMQAAQHPKFSWARRRMTNVLLV